MKINTCLSNQWRINKSPLEHIELVYTLKAVRKLLGYIDPDIEVIWSGMIPSGDNFRLDLPPSLVLGKYPIPSKEMDALLGFAVHEAFHFVERSAYVRDCLYRKYNNEEERNMVLQLAEVGEDIHIDGVARKKGIFGKYVQSFRDWWKENDATEIPKLFPSLEGVLDTYLNIVLDLSFPNTMPEDLDALDRLSDRKDTGIKTLAEIFCGNDRQLILGFHWIFIHIAPASEAPLSTLLTMTKKIIEGNHIERVLLYDNFWSVWGKDFIRWREEEEQRKKTQEEDETDSCPQTPSSELTPDLARELEQTIASDAKDQDGIMECALAELGSEHLKWALFPTAYIQSTKPCRTTPDPNLVHKIKRVFHLLKQENLKITRGLMSGKIDGSRLYRVPTTGTIFKGKEAVLETMWNIAVLVDASSSMASVWDLVESTYATLADACKGDSNKLGLFAYTEAKGTCNIENLYYGGRLFATTPGGSTPSAQAIMTVAGLMPKGHRRFLLHITDGKANAGLDMRLALAFCEKEHIELVTIGSKGFDIQELRDRYGSERFEIIETLEDLPDALATLLRTRLLGKR